MSRRRKILVDGGWNVFDKDRRSSMNPAECTTGLRLGFRFIRRNMNLGRLTAVMVRGSIVPVSTQYGELLYRTPHAVYCTRILRIPIALRRHHRCEDNDDDDVHLDNERRHHDDDHSHLLFPRIRPVASCAAGDSI